MLFLFCIVNHCGSAHSEGWLTKQNQSVDILIFLYIDREKPGAEMGSFKYGVMMGGEDWVS